MLRILIASLFSIVFLFNLPGPKAASTGTVLNAASLGHEPETKTQIAPGSIAVFRGSALGAMVTVNGQVATVLFALPSEVTFVVPENAAIGPAEIVVTTADGSASKAEAFITTAAPGVFTVGGNGQGEGIILDADRFVSAPFDPSNGQRRLSVFVTGVSRATSVSVTINEQPITVETVTRSNLAGLDEIHVVLPVMLAGAGAATLVVEADGVRSNPVSVSIAGLVTDKVVINQIFGGGGNSGAPFRNDFIEIFNAGNIPVSLAGWSIQYASATASTWSVTALTPVVLSSGQRYLIQQAGGNNGAALPAPDAAGVITMAAGAGKVALVKSTTPLTGACPIDPNIIDFAGYGSTANCFRGTGPAPGASNTNAATRNGNGCTDTRNNAADFALAPPNPRNTNAPFNQCTIAESVVTYFPDALAHRRNHHFAPALRL